MALHLSSLVEKVQDQVQHPAQRAKHLSHERAHNLGVHPRHWAQVVYQQRLKADGMILNLRYELPPAPILSTQVLLSQELRQELGRTKRALPAAEMNMICIQWKHFKFMFAGSIDCQSRTRLGFLQ